MVKSGGKWFEVVEKDAVCGRFFDDREFELRALAAVNPLNVADHLMRTMRDVDYASFVRR